MCVTPLPKRESTDVQEELSKSGEKGVICLNCVWPLGLAVPMLSELRLTISKKLSGIFQDSLG